MSVTTLARALHDGMCRSIDWCDGVQHSKTWRRVAQDVLSSAEPAATLHQHVCPAELDNTFRDGCGPDRERHIAHCAQWLEKR